MKKIFLSITFIFFACIFFSTAFSAQADTYFVKADGNDSLDGKSDATAWKTISKVNSYSFAVGDDVYFKCENEWSEKLGIDWGGNNINYTIIGSYYLDEKNIIQIGSNGEKPIIKGRPYTDINPLPSPRDGIPSWAGLVNIEKPKLGGVRDYIKVENLQILESAGACLRYYAYSDNLGNNIEFNNLYINGCTRDGITMSNCTNCVIENSEIIDTARIYIETGELNWPSSIGIHRNSKNGIIRNNLRFNSQIMLVFI